MIKKLSTVFCFLLFFCVITASVFTYRNGARFEAEHQITIVHYLSDKSFLHKVFDIKHTEAPPNPGNFTARELSYVFDMLDLNLLIWAGRLGCAHFLSTVKYLFVLLIVLICWNLFRQEFRLDRLQSACVILMFLTCPPVFHYSYYHRTAKIGTALGLTLIFYHLIKFALHREGRAARAVATFVIATATMLFDMQGLFFVLLIAGLLGSVLVFVRNKTVLAPLIALSGALILHLSYKYGFAFSIMDRLNDYAATSSYQSLSWSKVASFESFRDAVSLFADYFRNFAGAISPIWAWITMALLLTSHIVVDLKGKTFPWSLMIVGFGLGVLTMIYVSGTKNHAIYFPAVRLIGYGLPPTIVFLFIWSISIQRLQGIYPRLKPAISLVLVLLVARNVYFINQHKQMLDAHNEGPWDYASAMIHDLRQINVPGFVPRKFEYFDMDTKQVTTDRVFEALSTKMRK